MKALLKALSAVVVLSLGQMAMANVVTDAGGAVVDGVKTVGSTAWDSGKTVVKTLSHPGAVSVELGTFGYGANFAWSANDTTEVVAGWTGGDFSSDIDLQDSYINWNKVLGDEFRDFQGNLKLDTDMSNPYVGVNVRPWANRFYVGTGMIFQDNELNATLTPKSGTSTVRINGVDTPVNKVAVTMESGRSIAPYLTLGFKPNKDKRWGMFGELGAAYTGEWKTQAVVDDDPNSQHSQDLTNDLKGDNAKWYPIVKLGATYRF